MKAKPGMATLQKEARRQLEVLADPEVRASMLRLVPNTKILGVKVPQIRSLAVEWAKKHPMEFEAAVGFFGALCEADLREEILLGIFLLAQHKRRLGEIRWSDIENWLDHIDNWETCDQLASNIAAPAVAVNPALRAPLRSLTRKDLWRRRFAVATGAALNQHGRFVPELTLEICQDLHDDEHLAIRKAVGWAIRELSKKDEDIAFDFLMEHRDRIARGLMREATEKLHDARREQLLLR